MRGVGYDHRVSSLDTDTERSGIDPSWRNQAMKGTRLFGLIAIFCVGLAGVASTLQATDAD
jgi:hypothetical protein